MARWHRQAGHNSSPSPIAIPGCLMLHPKDFDTSSTIAWRVKEIQSTYPGYLQVR